MSKNIFGIVYYEDFPPLYKYYVSGGSGEVWARFLAKGCFGRCLSETQCLSHTPLEPLSAKNLVPMSVCTTHNMCKLNAI